MEKFLSGRCHPKHYKGVKKVIVSGSFHGDHLDRVYDKNGKAYNIWDWINAYTNAVKDGHKPFNMQGIQIIFMISACGMANKLIIKTK